MAPKEFIKELDIVDVIGEYVPLTRKGNSFWGLCPFHAEKAPSFSVSRDKQTYHCFGCGKEGGVISFVMEIEHLSFPDAVRHLAKRSGIEVPNTSGSDEGHRKYHRAIEANRMAARFYQNYLNSKSGTSVRDYIAQRRISSKFVTRFGLGAAPGDGDTLTKALTAKGFSKTKLIDAGLAIAGKNGGLSDKFRSRLMLPVIDVRGDVVGFTSRILPGLYGAKYLNSSDTVCFKKSQLVYGLNFAKATKRPNLILVEGNIDVITLHQVGFDNVVATMGTAFTADHARILSQYTKELVICYDNDEAGVRSTDRALEILQNTDLTVRVLHLPNAYNTEGKPIKQDPDDFVKKYGPAAFEKQLNNGIGQNDYRLDRLLYDADLTTDEGRMTFLHQAVEMVGALNSPIEREIYGGKAAKTAGITPADFAQEVEQFRRDRERRKRLRETRRELNPTMTRHPPNRCLRYENIRSALAEEGVLRLLLMEPTLFDRIDLTPEEFSSKLLGRVYALWQDFFAQGLSIQLSSLVGTLNEQEMDHIAQVLSVPEPLLNAAEAIENYIRIIREEGPSGLGGGV